MNYFNNFEPRVGDNVLLRTNQNTRKRVVQILDGRIQLDDGTESAPNLYNLTIPISHVTEPLGQVNRRYINKAILPSVGDMVTFNGLIDRPFVVQTVLPSGKVDLGIGQAVPSELYHMDLEDVFGSDSDSETNGGKKTKKNRKGE
jgi:hypothetical protein